MPKSTQPKPAESGPMKRFLLLGGDCYYPSGGLDDFIASFDTAEECQARFGKPDYSTWAQVVDTTTWRIVAETVATGGRGATKWGPADRDVRR